MNFDAIKSKMEQESENQQIPDSVSSLTESNLPVNRIRRKFKGEIITMIVVMGLLILYPQIQELHPLPRSVYYGSCILIILISLGYLLKMQGFLRKTRSMDLKTHSALHAYIYEIKLTLEVYKVSVVSSSLPLPFLAIAFWTGRVNAYPVELFSKWFLLDISSSEIVMLVTGYLLLAVFFYVLTIKWIKYVYGKHLADLEKVLKDLEE